MKLTILFSSAVLFATTLIPISAYADDQNLMCNRSGNGCNSRGGSGKLSISGLNVSVNTTKSSDRSNRNRGVNSSHNNAAAGPSDNTINDSNDTADIDNNTDNTNNTVDADNGTENDNDTVADNNTNPPQLNSNDIKGFDPFGGLYGPGT